MYWNVAVRQSSYRPRPYHPFSPPNDSLTNLPFHSFFIFTAILLTQNPTRTHTLSSMTPPLTSKKSKARLEALIHLSVKHATFSFESSRQKQKSILDSFSYEDCILAQDARCKRQGATELPCCFLLPPLPFFSVNLAPLSSEPLPSSRFLHFHSFFFLTPILLL